ncbi:MAG: chemotaxis protein CheW [Chlamydiales bacterium]|nr:chemotaxis protein CheW [Chlamydiia bacterium]MCP5508334.1 chemotaxis protein CheW [Chlamydiales bacterium]
MSEKKYDGVAKDLLLRQPVSDYKQEWTDELAAIHEENEPKKIVSLLVFRLCNEWLGITTTIFSEIFELRPIHTIPHRTNQILRGTVNFRGRLRLCVALHSLLEVEEVAVNEKYQESQLGDARMVAIHQDDEEWIFAVDEVLGIVTCDLHDIENVPVTVSKSKANFLKGIIAYNDISIGYLEEELIFYSLRRAIH